MWEKWKWRETRSSTWGRFTCKSNVACWMSYGHGKASVSRCRSCVLASNQSHGHDCWKRLCGDRHKQSANGFLTLTSTAYDSTHIGTE
jgi:hypothetical protein